MLWTTNVMERPCAVARGIDIRTKVQVEPNSSAHKGQRAGNGYNPLKF
jgi:hypothetical protein